MTVQQNERSYEEGESKGERGSSTPCQVQHIGRAEIKPRGETGGIMLNTSAVGCIHLSVRQSASPSVRGK